MNLAIKFWKDLDNPTGIPNEWPAQVKEIGEQTEYSDASGPWVVMSTSDYLEYRNVRRNTYNAWDSTRKQLLAYGLLPWWKKVFIFLKRIFHVV